MQQKQVDSLELADKIDSGALDDVMQLRQEVSSQIKALADLKVMAQRYGYDISKPATSFKEAVLWLYLSYLAACKQQDGAAMSVGRIDSFLDIYAERDLKAGKIKEREIQEIIDDFVIKLRVIRFLRHPAFDEMYAGNPIWATLTLGGMLADEDGKKRKKGPCQGEQIFFQAFPLVGKEGGQAADQKSADGGGITNVPPRFRVAFVAADAVDVQAKPKQDKAPMLDM